MKNIIYIFLVCNYFAFASYLNAQIPENGLIAYYPFNGNADDRSGNCINGTAVNVFTTTDRFNYEDAAFHFGGFADNYVYIPGSSFGLEEFTYSVWALAENLPFFGDFQAVISIGGDDFRDQQIAIRNDGYGATSYNTDQTNFIMFSNMPDVIGKWTHIVFSRSDKKVKLYVNGVLVDDQNVPGFLKPFYSFNLIATVGLRHNSTNPFNGKIDDIRIYNRELTSDEVLSLYNEHICYENISVTDTLIINTNITSYSPINYSIKIKVYPNPTADHLIIDAGNISNLNGYSIKISSSSGVEVFQSTIDKQFFDVDMTKWKGKGLYFLNLYDQNFNLIDVKKIILQ